MEREKKVKPRRGRGILLLPRQSWGTQGISQKDVSLYTGSVMTPGTTVWWITEYPLPQKPLQMLIPLAFNSCTQAPMTCQALHKGLRRERRQSLIRWFSKQSSLASPGNLSDAQILQLHPRPTKLETQGVGPSPREFSQALQGFLMHTQVWDHHSNFQNNSSKQKQKKQQQKTQFFKVYITPFLKWKQREALKG